MTELGQTPQSMAARGPSACESPRAVRDRAGNGVSTAIRRRPSTPPWTSTRGTQPPSELPAIDGVDAPYQPGPWLLTRHAHVADTRALAGNEAKRRVREDAVSRRTSIRAAALVSCTRSTLHHLSGGRKSAHRAPTMTVSSPPHNVLPLSLATRGSTASGSPYGF